MNHPKYAKIIKIIKAMIIASLIILRLLFSYGAVNERKIGIFPTALNIENNNRNA